MRNLLFLAALAALMTMSVACSTAGDNNGATQNQTSADGAESPQDDAEMSNDAAGDTDEDVDAEHEGDTDDDADHEGDADDDAEHEEGDGDMHDDDAENEDDADAAHGEGEEAGGKGMAHRRNEDDHHNQMLDEAIALGLITQADKEFFLATHEILDETSPRPMDESGKADSEAKKTKQRGRTEIAVAAGALSQEDADRFTEIHDILIDNDLMDH
jgi:hypothetical protein